MQKKSTKLNSMASRRKKNQQNNSQLDNTILPNINQNSSRRVLRSQNTSENQNGINENVHQHTSFSQFGLTSTPNSSRFNVPQGFKLVREDQSQDIEVIQQNTISKPKLQIYKGLDDNVNIENWVKRYEIISNFYKWTSEKQCVMLGNYLQDDALNFYIENYSENWSELKSKLLNRFGHETVDPIVEFINTKYDIKTGIKSYFDTKGRLGTLAKLSEEQMIPLMIQGLHPKMIDKFVSIKPKTFNEFYQTAKTIEDNYKNFGFMNHNNNKNSYNKNMIRNMNKNIKPNDNKLKRRPHNPCKICENLRHANRYHWANDCRNC